MGSFQKKSSQLSSLPVKSPAIDLRFSDAPLAALPGQLTTLVKNKSSNLIEFLPDGFLVLTPQGNITYANLMAQQILYRSKSHILLNTLFVKALGRTSRRKFIQILHRARTGEIIVDELNILAVNNEIRPINLVIALLNKRQPTEGFQVVLRDIHDKKKREEELRHLEKMQVVQNFISGTAQQIYHPLKVLLDRSNHLLDKYKKREFEYLSFNDFQNILDSLDLMVDQIRYCYETISRVMKLNKKRTGKNEFCNEFNQIIRQIIYSHRQHMETNNIKVSFREGKNLPAVAINQIDLEQVIQNVIANAMQSMPGGGKITVKTFVGASGKEIHFECSDTGVGIPREILPHLFEPFFAVKHRSSTGHKSSGLGLSIVYSIVQSHHGRIDIKSNLRKGTTVRIFLPVAVVAKTKKQSS